MHEIRVRVNNIITNVAYFVRSHADGFIILTLLILVVMGMFSVFKTVHSWYHTKVPTKVVQQDCINTDLIEIQGSRKVVQVCRFLKEPKNNIYDYAPTESWEAYVLDYHVPNATFESTK